MCLYKHTHTHSKMVNFTQEDKNILSSYGVKVNRDMPIFIKELYDYLKNEWHEESHNELEPLKNNDLDGFNKNIGFPGYRGYGIIDDSFTGIMYDDIPKLSKTSRELLGWIYGIYLHN